MCCYLYAAFSLKRVDTRLERPVRRDAGRSSWRRVINVRGARGDERTCALVGNLMNALGFARALQPPGLSDRLGPLPVRLRHPAAAVLGRDHGRALPVPGTAVKHERPWQDGGWLRAAARPTAAPCPKGRLSPGGARLRPPSASSTKPWRSRARRPSPQPTARPRCSSATPHCQVDAMPRATARCMCAVNDLASAQQRASTPSSRRAKVRAMRPDRFALLPLHPHGRRTGTRR